MNVRREKWSIMQAQCMEALKIQRLRWQWEDFHLKVALSFAIATFLVEIGVFLG